MGLVKSRLAKEVPSTSAFISYYLLGTAHGSLRRLFVIRMDAKCFLLIAFYRIAFVELKQRMSDFRGKSYR